MRKLAYSYYLENGSLTGMTNADVGVDYTCASTDFYRFTIADNTGTYVNLGAVRCTSGGKMPNVSREYVYYLRFYPGSGQSEWYCMYIGDSSPCFGLPPE
jgi:hypothetical protein